MDNGKPKQKIIAQGVCLLLAISLWFYVVNVENPIKKQTVTNIEIEVINENSLTGLGLALSPNQEFYSSLKVEGTMQQLRGISNEKFKLQVDLSEYALKVGENKVPIKIKKCPDGVNVQNQDILVLDVLIEEFIEKEIPIVSGITLEGSQGHYVSAPIFKDEKVKVSGPKSLVNKVEKVEARGAESNISQDIIKRYTLYPLDKDGALVGDVKLGQEKVEVTINSNKGKVVPVKIQTTGELPNGSRLDLLDSTVKEIEIIGPEEILSSIIEVKTKLIDLEQITDNTNIEVGLIIPEGVSVTSATGSSIEIKVNITKLAKKDFILNITFSNLNTDLKLKQEVIESNLTIRGYEEVLNTINEENLKLEIDLSEYLEAGEYKIIPKVIISEIDGEVQFENQEEITIILEKELVEEAE